MTLIISKPAKTAMQSGDANTKRWLLTVTPEDARFIDPLMGWTGSGDMNQEVKLYFESKEEAIAYAEGIGAEYEVLEPQERKIVPKSYADNFQ